MTDLYAADKPGLERHYTAEELGKMWHVGANTIRRMFQDEPGVFKFGLPPKRGKRTLTSMRIPQHVADRVWRRHLVKESKAS